jgi:hypothetical protein
MIAVYTVVAIPILPAAAEMVRPHPILLEIRLIALAPVRRLQQPEMRIA